MKKKTIQLRSQVNLHAAKQMNDDGTQMHGRILRDATPSMPTAYGPTRTLKMRLLEEYFRRENVWHFWKQELDSLRPMNDICETTNEITHRRRNRKTQKENGARRVRVVAAKY